MKIHNLNIRGQLLSLETPLVMGIVNVTPDSFYSGSRIVTEEALRQRVDTIITEGGSIVDLGAYSTRPGAAFVSIDQEKERLRPALRMMRDEYPNVPVSVDTWRSDVARWAVEEYGAGIINDVSGGTMDKAMFKTISEIQVPYILMHMRGTPETMQSLTEYDNIGLDILDFFIQKSTELRELGVHDLIIDPGFGFAKILEQNYELMATLSRYQSVLELPMLVGISRKSMIYRLLDISPEESLNGTSILNTYALLNGANILRVHDVRAAVESVRLISLLKHYEPQAENSIYRIDRPYNPTH